MSSSLLAPLKLRSYRRLVIGDILSGFGNWLDITALMVLLVYQWGLGPSSTATLMVTLGIPMVVLGPILSVWVDRLPLKGFVLTIVGLRVLLILGLIFVPNFYALLVIVFLRATLATLFFPARQAMVRSLVPKEQLASAISVGQLSLNLTMIAAPAIGGALIPFIGTKTIFAIEAGLVFLALLVLMGLPKMERPKAPLPAGDGRTQSAPQKGKFLTELKAGFAHIAGSRQLTVAILLISIGMFLVFLYDGLLVIWAKGIGFGESGYGLMMSVIGLGSVGGALLAGSVQSWRKSPLRLMALVGLLAGLLNIVIGLGGLQIFTLALPLWGILFLLFGLCGAVATVPFGYLLQTETPEHLIGRVSSVSASMQNAVTLLAPAIGATLAEFYSVGPVFIGAGVLMFLLAMLTLLFLRRILGKKHHLPVQTDSAAQ